MKAWQFCHQNNKLFGLQWRHGNPRSREPRLFEFQWRQWNHVKRNQDCLGFNEGMEILSAGKTIGWVLMTACKSCEYCFGVSQCMETMSKGTTKSVWVQMQALTFCHKENTMFGLQWRQGNLVNGKQRVVEFQCRHENPVKRNGTKTVGVSMKAWEYCQQEKQLFGF